MSDGMTKGERQELAKVARLRARVAKANVAHRQAQMLAEFETQMATTYGSDDARWSDLTTAAKQGIEELDRQLAEKCAELGIPERFRPALHLGWADRGENGDRKRRTELRAVARLRIDADAKRAKLAIDAREAEVLTALVAGGLESDAARSFLESIPTPDQLMPAVDLDEVEAEHAQMSPTERRMLR